MTPAATIREALIRRREAAALAALTELEQQLAERPTLDEAMKNVNYWKDKAVAAEADRDRLQRENKRLTNDLDDLQRANDKMRGENQKLRRGDVVADRDRLAAENRRLRDCVGLLDAKGALQFWHNWRTHPALDRQEV